MGATAKDIFDGWVIIGCCVLSHEYMAMTLQQTEDHPEFEEDELPLIRFALYDVAEEEGEWWGWVDFEGPSLKHPKIVHTELEEFVAVDSQGLVFYMGLGEDKVYDKLIGDSFGEDWGGVYNLTNINGTIYGAYIRRTLYKRLGRDKWEKYDEANTFPGYEKLVIGGFNDVDGFSETDIYCVGADQDVWHFNGEKWKSLDICDGLFDARAVCCAEDGYVYIGFQDGRIAKGRDDQWVVSSSDSSLHSWIESIVYYRGKVLVGVDEATFVFNDDLTFTMFDFDEQLDHCGGAYIYTAYDKLMIANMYNQVAFFDGEKWLDINGCSELNPLEREALERDAIKKLDALTEEMQEIIDKQ